MGTIDPQNLLVLLAGTVAALALIILLAVGMVRRSRANPTPQAVPLSTPEFGSVRRPEASPKEETIATPVPPPTRLAVPQSAQREPQQSYAAIATVQSTPGTASRAAAPPERITIDYANALDTINPDASYTATAIASALGVPANTNSAFRPETSAGQSYAAIAAAAATFNRAKPQAIPTRIDYSGEITDVPPNASYAAIAVATAARQV